MQIKGTTDMTRETEENQQGRGEKRLTKELDIKNIKMMLLFVCTKRALKIIHGQLEFEYV